MASIHIRLCLPRVLFTYTNTHSLTHTQPHTAAAAGAGREGGRRVIYLARDVKGAALTRSSLTAEGPEGRGERGRGVGGGDVTLWGGRGVGDAVREEVTCQQHFIGADNSAVLPVGVSNHVIARCLERVCVCVCVFLRVM